MYTTRPPVRMLFPMETLVSNTKIDITHPGSLTEIPSFGVVTQAISMLYKKRETINNDLFVYVKFPFGVLDFNGLKELQKYHQYLKMKDINMEVYKVGIQKMTINQLR